MGFNIALIVIATVSVLSCCILALAYGWRLGVVIVFAGLPPMLASGYTRIRLESAMDHKISETVFCKCVHCFGGGQLNSNGIIISDFVIDKTVAYGHAPFCIYPKC